MRKTPFLHLLPPRLHAACRRLQCSVWQIASKPLKVYASQPSRSHVCYSQRPKNLTAVETVPEFWGKPFEQRWWKIELHPEQLENFTHLQWRDQAEATVYINGFPSGGFDPAHSFVELPQSFEEIFVESYCTQAAIWVPGVSSKISSQGSRFDGAYLARRDEEAWQAYLDFSVLFELVTWLASREPNFLHPERFASGMFHREEWHEAEPILRLLVHELDIAVEKWETDGLGAMREKLRGIFDRLSFPLPHHRVTAVGHAHIDLVWLWPEDVTAAKLVHTFSTVERLLEKYPEFVFSHSQPAAYRLLAEREPALHKRVMERVAQGRWEPVGAMEVEADSNLPCGEALVRCFWLGQAEFQRICGEKSRILWLPDSFGYSACIPTLMSEFGVEFFFSAKFAWSEATRFPYTSFRWRGMDGSEVIAHLLHDYAAAYNRMGHVEDVLLPLHAHRQSHVHPELLLPLGMGDGGGGPSEETCERLRRYHQLYGLPQTEWGQISEFFERMRSCRQQLPIWDGEIFLEYHRGVYSTQVAMKQAYRRLECALQVLEAAKAILGEELDESDRKTWQRLCFAQFHDCLPGSSIAEVYDKIVPELQKLEEQCIEKALALTGGDQADADAIFNPLPLPVVTVVEDGRLLHLPALATRPIESAEPLRCLPQGDEKELVLQCGNTLARFSADGAIEELVLNGKAIRLGKGAGQIRVCPDYPAEFAAWNVDRNSPATEMRLCDRPRLQGFFQEKTKASVQFALRVTDKSDVVVEYSISSDYPVLRIRVEVNWHEPQTLVQIAFPTRYRGGQGRFGAPYGSVMRSQLERGLAADALFEVPASRWVVVGDDGEAEGLALVTRDRYGFGIRDGTLHCTLLRSALLPDKAAEDARDGKNFTDLGRHCFELALAWGGVDAPLHLQPPALADALFTRPVRARRGFTPEAGLLELTNTSSLIPAWVKPAEGRSGWVLRLHETRGRAGTARLLPAQGFALSVTDLQEEKREWIRDNELSFSAYCVRSLLFSKKE